MSSGVVLRLAESRLARVGATAPQAESACADTLVVDASRDPPAVDIEMRAEGEAVGTSVPLMNLLSCIVGPLVVCHLDSNSAALISA